MKSASLPTLRLVMLVLLSLSAVLHLSARTLTVHYYPDASETDPLSFALSYNGDDSSAQSNPTFVLPARTTTVFQIPPKTRAWWWMPALGWEFGYPSDQIQSNWDVSIYVGNDTGSVRQVWVTPVSAGLTVEEQVELFMYGFWFAAALELFGMMWRTFKNRTQTSID